MVLHQFVKLIKNQMNVITLQIVKYYRDYYIGMLQLQWVAPLSLSVTWQQSLTFSSPWSMSLSHIQQILLDWNCCSSSLMIKFLLKCSFITSMLIFLKNCFNKFISSNFTCKNNYWFSKFIINTNKFVNKTTSNVISIFSWVRAFIIFDTLQITLKTIINFKWNWYLFEIIFKLNRSCVLSTYLYGAFDRMFLSCHVRGSEWIHTL